MRVSSHLFPDVYTQGWLAQPSPYRPPAMDVAREGVVEAKRRRRLILAGSGVVAALLLTLGLSRLKPAAPTVEKSTVWIDTVKRGPMLRQVRGPGSLVPEAEGIRWISAATDGRVERLLVQPGAIVKPDTVLLEMSNPELDRDALDAEWQLKAAQAEATNVKVRLQRELMDQQAAAATVESDFHQAELPGADERGPLQGGPRRRPDPEAVAGARRGAQDAKRDREEAARGLRRVRQGADRRPGGARRAAARAREPQAVPDRRACTCGPGSPASSRSCPLQVGQRVTPGTNARQGRAARQAEGAARRSPRRRPRTSRSASPRPSTRATASSPERSRASIPRRRTAR